ncbi:MAG: hypothetical protein RO469_13230 [Thermincola sp.]|jgi:DNA-directed RNA polymerase subunit RPC12/RpoP|nr:hypothetical protein [Thermincola sp.]MDT3702224.1 hypothetical protein [Thermincola sp.]
MAKAKYVCGQCGRTSGLPDFCCGRTMVQKGNFYCKSCGSSTAIAGDCCGQPMSQL